MRVRHLQTHLADQGAGEFQQAQRAACLDFSLALFSSNGERRQTWSGLCSINGLLSDVISLRQTFLGCLIES